MDVQSEFVENAMSNQSTLSTPENEVNSLLSQVAEEHNLELNVGLPQANKNQAVGNSEANNEQNDLTTRLAELRGK